MGSDLAMPARKPKRETAESMARKQREISVSEFFLKNRHLLGFDNPRKALLTTVKEAVDNALDACEEAGIVPESPANSPASSRTSFISRQAKMANVADSYSPGAAVKRIVSSTLAGTGTCLESRKSLVMAGRV